MKSTVNSKGQTQVPKKLRDRFKMGPGTTLDWREDGDTLRVIKLPVSRKAAAGLEWLKRLGRIPAAPRDRRPVHHD